MTKHIVGRITPAHPYRTSSKELAVDPSLIGREVSPVSKDQRWTRGKILAVYVGTSSFLAENGLEQGPPTLMVAIDTDQGTKQLSLSRVILRP